MIVFDPQTEQFSKAGLLGTAGPLGGAVATLPDGDAVLIGGFPSSAATAAVRIDARTLAVAATPGQPHSHRIGATATRLADGTVLLAGGLLAVTEDGNAIGVGTSPDGTVELFDAGTGSFTLLPGGLNVPRSRHAAIATADGGALIVGGIAENGQPAPVELYDPARRRFTVVPTPDVGARANATVTAAMDNGIWIAGGDDGSNVPAALGSVLRCDAATKAVTRPLDLAQPRTRFAGALLTDGRWLLSGGMQGQALDTTEILDLRSAMRAAGPRLLVARHSHTATVLRSGKVLILGGTGTDGQAIPSAEIFE
ncbi:kelch motif-containing protein [Pelomonas sp. P8]|uniref:Kelch motif-containing protein n=2 Tax=Pelomonas cellulosilytica TaxID=2906762 RepID=A0ABS8Y4C5_9BURK|nr:kelch motif-containing protein [Pelomonas sp. P8]